MPRTYASRRSTKRPYKKRSRKTYGVSRLVVPRTQYGFYGESMYRTHTLAHKFNLDPAAAATVDTGTFRANDMYLPYVGSTHRPYGFNVVADMYSHFTVTRCHLKLHIINAGGYKAFIGINAYPGDNIVDSTITALIEQPGCKYLFLDPDNAGTGKSGGTLTYDLDLGTYFGRSKSAMINSSAYRGSPVGSPAELAYLIITTRAFSDAADLGSVSCIAELTYDAVWTEPAKIFQS